MRIPSFAIPFLRSRQAHSLPFPFPSPSSTAAAPTGHAGQEDVTWRARSVVAGTSESADKEWFSSSDLSNLIITVGVDVDMSSDDKVRTKIGEKTIVLLILV